MNVIFDGDFIYPLREYNENIPIILDSLNISNEIKSSIRKWLNQYSRYTPMTLEQLSNNWNQIDNLDKQGCDLLRKIMSEWNNTEVEKYYYFSLCRDKLKLIIYKNGSEREFL